MSATIKIKNSSTTGSVPSASNLVQGELAVNVTDLGLYTENASGTVVKLNAPSIDDKNTGATKYLTIDTSGNLGLGVTPSAWSTFTALQIKQGSISSAGGELNLMANAYYDGTNYRRIVSGGVGRQYFNTDGSVAWYQAGSSTAGSTISFTQAMTLDTSGRLGIGETSPAAPLDVKTTNAAARFNSSDANGVYAAFSVNGTAKGYIGSSYQMVTSGSANDFAVQAVNNFVFATGGSTERARIDSAGNFLVGVASSTFKFSVAVGSGENVNIASFDGANYGSYFYTGQGTQAANAAATVCKMTKNSSTGRSLNAGGTVNASGADYAEYMTKAGSFSIAKGDVVGINAEGKLTNVFADAVSFCVKSTDPSYVGGDVWGSAEVLGLHELTDESTEEEKATFEAALETARQTVDRIAFAGQVPVNVTGATAGQYIIPVNDNGSIKGQAVSNPTFEQYQLAVGKVIAIEQDGRAKIIVKVA